MSETVSLDALGVPAAPDKGRCQRDEREARICSRAAASAVHGPGYN